MARFDIRRKTERNRQLYQYWKEHQDCSWQEIGNAFNITRQRAAQIVKKEQEKEAAGLIPAA